MFLHPAIGLFLLISYGTEDTKTKYPAVGFVYSRFKVNGEEQSPAQCSGILIAPRVVLTAGHCTAARIIRDYQGASDIRTYVVFESDIATATKESSMDTTQSILHPTYGTRMQYRCDIESHKQEPLCVELAACMQQRNDDVCMRNSWAELDMDKPNFVDDIGLIILKDPIRTIPPMRLATAVKKRRGIGVGYGDRAEAGSPKRSYGPVTVTEVGSHELVAGIPEKETLACDGDSGGPLIVSGKVAGVMSRSASPDPCGKIPNIYTRVDAYASWIRKEIAKLRMH